MSNNIWTVWLNGQDYPENPRGRYMYERDGFYVFADKKLKGVNAEIRVDLVRATGQSVEGSRDD